MKAFLTALMLMLISSFCQAQQTGKTRRVSGIAAPQLVTQRIYVSQMAEFPGNSGKWVHEHLRYPDEARENGITGRVEILFEIGIEGTVQNVSVRRSSGSAVLDKEAGRVVGAMPKWNPAKFNGRPISYKMVLPVVFRIN